MGQWHIVSCQPWCQSQHRTVLHIECARQHGGVTRKSWLSPQNARTRNEFRLPTLCFAACRTRTVGYTSARAVLVAVYKVRLLHWEMQASRDALVEHPSVVG
eukprot:3603806-Amphidinium_carterae.1